MKKQMSSFFSILMGVAMATAGLSGQAQAVPFDINVCWTECSNLSLPDVTVATLDITQNGVHVDFTLTNSVANLGAFADASTFISNLHFTYTGNSLANTDFSAVTGGTFTTGPPGPGTTFPPINSFTDAALSFNLNLGLPTANNNPGARFTNGEVINWTVSNDVVANFTSGLNSQPQFLMAHTQSLVGGGSTKYVNGTSTVPEPNSLLLLGAGLAAIGIWKRKGWR